VVLKLQGKYQLLVSADGNNLFGSYIISVKRTQNIFHSLVRGSSRRKALENACGSWSVTIREKYALRVFDNKKGS